MGSTSRENETTIVTPTVSTLAQLRITYTAARANITKTMDRVIVDHDPVIITRNREQSVVLLSLDDYQALEKTAFLLR